MLFFLGTDFFIEGEILLRQMKMALNGIFVHQVEDVAEFSCALPDQIISRVCGIRRDWDRNAV